MNFLSLMKRAYHSLMASLINQVLPNVEVLFEEETRLDEESPFEGFLDASFIFGGILLIIV